MSIFNWLRQSTTFFAEVSGSILSVDQLMEQIVSVLSLLSEDEWQSGLLDLLGYDHLEFIEQLLLKRADILKAFNEAKNQTKAQTLSGHRPPLQSQFTVKIKKTKNLRNNLDVLSTLGFDDEFLEEQRSQGLRPSLASAPSSSVQSDFSDLLSSTAGLKTVLPEGTIRKQYDGVDEYRIPASKAHIPDPATLIKIASLPGFARKIFNKETSLNSIQSAVYSTAFGTDENFLMCAPTSAGKTNVALLAIARLIGEHAAERIEFGSSGSETPFFLANRQFKAVYLAPMKALVSEIVDKFTERLSPLGVVVKELTGDMQLTKKELMSTQIIVTVPEKWDVVTRNLAEENGSNDGEASLSSQLKLIIVDEVHLLNEDRGAVIEALLARISLRIEKEASHVRIVGLSATLPNYLDVAAFLNVSTKNAFFFGSEFRPVALEQTLCGISSPGGTSGASTAARLAGRLNEVAFQHTSRQARNGHQCMVFVHSRIDTVKTAEFLIEEATKQGDGQLFLGDSVARSKFASQFAKCKDKKLQFLFERGFLIHHAGMIRSDRSLVEKAFLAGACMCLVSTATLAWGVNLPARAVIIKGTSIWDSAAGGYVPLGVFGRAGRPQFDTQGEAILITNIETLPFYVKALTNQTPIESCFEKFFANALNAEIAIGTVTNIREACEWLKFTYFYIRMFRAPMKWGITEFALRADPSLKDKRRELILAVASRLNEAKLIRVDASDNFQSTDLGRVAARFYVDWETSQLFLSRLRSSMMDAEILELFGLAKEFTQLKVREDEQQELEDLSVDKTICPVKVRGGPATIQGKVALLLQALISGAVQFKASSLASDLNYVSQNAGRLFRALFQITLTRTVGMSGLAEKVLDWCKCVERRVWDPPYGHILRHFTAGANWANVPGLSLAASARGLLPDWIPAKLEEKGDTFSFWKLRDMRESEIAGILRVPVAAEKVLFFLKRVPFLDLNVQVQPITGNIVRVSLSVLPNFEWSDRFHGNSQTFHVWVLDPESDDLLHHETLSIPKRDRNSDFELSFIIPLSEPRPPQYILEVISDSWVGVSFEYPFEVRSLAIPIERSLHTELLDLAPLPVSAVQDPLFIDYFSHLSFFNPIQTQAFHALFHSDVNILVGAPTGSGKTVISEIAIFRLFMKYPKKKVIYIAPLKALSRERIGDWGKRFPALGKRVVELTGDVMPDIEALVAADVVVTTPEKWDGITRNWKSRSYVAATGLVVIDEIHLLGADRGPVLEAIVSRMRYIACQTESRIRFVGLSTALANARDIGDWLGVGSTGLFNFKPAVRPVPMTVHVQGYPEKHYCPRMATMNKPCLTAIMNYSPNKPVLIFVASRRQTRLTSLDLIAHLAQDESCRSQIESGSSPWLHLKREEVPQWIERVTDQNLKHTIAFGVGMHHAGLAESDRNIVETLFLTGKIQILVATATLAWGVNFPAHLVIVKGTEYYDGDQKKYIDFPITDVLQMIGRAGRPQFDDSAVAVVMAHEPKRAFYRQFLYSPFPVESSLHKNLTDNLNAEVSLGSIASMTDAIEYLTWTYFFRRLTVNPSYYKPASNLSKKEDDDSSKYLQKLLSESFEELRKSSCVNIQEPSIGKDGTFSSMSLASTSIGKIASTYYLSHFSLRAFQRILRLDVDIETLLKAVSDSYEYREVPVRHNEEKLNEGLAEKLDLSDTQYGSFESPHVKTLLLLQAHIWRVPVPIADYKTDLKNVLDQFVRIVQAMVDVAVLNSSLNNVLNLILLQQSVYQAIPYKKDPLLVLPGLKEDDLTKLRRSVSGGAGLAMLVENVINLKTVLDRSCEDAQKYVQSIPKLRCSAKLLGNNQLKVKIVLENQPPSFATTPFFHKKNPVSVWCVVSTDDSDVIGVKRMKIPRNKGPSTESNFQFELKHSEYKVYFMLDAYVGLDQIVSVQQNI
jgi:activating signal cointegrator complex subunit 3